MGSLKLIFVYFVAALSANVAYSQCCCSGPYLNITDGGGFALKASDVRVESLFPERKGDHVSVRNAARDEANYYLRVGCGDGKETVLVEYMGVQMRVRFKFGGDYGHPQVDIPFGTGDYVAEFAKEREDDGARKLVLRPATPEEMKEIEPPAPPDGPSDQTTNSF